MAELARRAQNVNPGYPGPLVPGGGLGPPQLAHSDSEEGDDTQALDIEDDVEEPRTFGS